MSADLSTDLSAEARSSVDRVKAEARSAKLETSGVNSSLLTPPDETASESQRRTRVDSVTYTDALACALSASILMTSLAPAKRAARCGRLTDKECES